MKILLIQTAFIGDVVLATSLIEKLHAHDPAIQIHFLLRKGNEGLLFDHPYLKKIWIWDKKRSKYANLVRLLFSIRNEHFDTVINCQRFAASGWITACSNAKSRIGYAKNPLSWFYTEKYPHTIGEKGDASYLHEIERNQQLIGRLTEGDAVNPKLYPSAEDFEITKPFKEKKYLTISPVSVWFTKQLPKKKWKELIDKIPDSYHIYLLGGPDDHLMCNEIRAAVSREQIINLAGKLSFLQTAALMKDAEMNYTNDSAPLHFASAMNANVTAIFCSTIPEFGFGPLSDISYLLEEKEQLYCRPCGLHGFTQCPEKHFRCALNIPVSLFLKDKV